MDNAPPSQAVEPPARQRIWHRDAPHAPLPRDTERTIGEAAQPLTDIGDALSRPHVQKSLNNNMLEVMAWDLMEALSTENEYNQHIRRFLNILLGDDPDTAHLELIDSHSTQEAAYRDQLLLLVQESLSRSDEFLHRVTKSRDKVTFAIEQKTQLKRQLEKMGGAGQPSRD
ncbi:hypothetical protein IWQ56_005808 [Coemansia nantahalensis]|uniref:Uncharacterized protein n=2 Tax=Coemansia TaxID=4863 RepID=A0ACC1KW70_9FUNG|nr:hypothetical protein IWQ56_005808 [Coemansia nantahalensis]KAJ2764323.1 hypothetical protein IWQ57_005205 [Coemansia nantahalensis]KAJ2795858.1 hypothetical protein H4R21_004940 [Coemansia helicoidea]